jgi:hypothetical protein
MAVLLHVQFFFVIWVYCDWVLADLGYNEEGKPSEFIDCTEFLNRIVPELSSDPPRHKKYRARG